MLLRKMFGGTKKCWPQNPKIFIKYMGPPIINIINTTILKVKFDILTILQLGVLIFLNFIFN